MRPPIRAVLIDLSGTLHVGSSAIPGAVAALQRLRDARIPFRFCSNMSKESARDLSSRLKEMGFDVRSAREGGEEEVWTSLGAVRKMIENKGLRRPYFLLSDSAREECAQSLAPSPDLPYDSVVVGLAPAQFTYDNLTTAFRVLIGEHPAPLIATHRAKYVRTPDDALSLGPGPFVAALEHASGVRAEVAGKPGRAFFESVIASFGRGNETEGRIAVIGDDVEADLGGGAVELGLWRVLVKTGKYRPGDENREGCVPPDEVQESVATWIDGLLGH